MTKQIVLGLLFLGLATTSSAAVDFQRAAFSLEEVDSLKINHSQSLELYRRYHSRSLYRGLFGFGWCSLLDWKLQASDKGALYLKKCDQSIHPVSGRNFQHGDFELSFNDEGHITRILFKTTDNELKIYYKDKSITFLSLSAQMIAISQDFQGRIIEMGALQKEPLRFVYDELHLTHGSGFEYQYSEYSNLTGYSSRTRGQGQLIYNEFDDQLVSWYRDDGCFLKLQYHPKSEGFEVLSEELCTSADLIQSRQKF